MHFRDAVLLDYFVEAQRSYSRNRLAALHSQVMAARPQPHAVAGDEALHASVAQERERRRRFSSCMASYTAEPSQRLHGVGHALRLIRTLDKKIPDLQGPRGEERGRT